MDGFIKLPRSLLMWEWFDDPSSLKFYINLLFIAEWRERRYKGVEIKRGQIVATVDELSRRFGLSVRQTRTLLERLKSTNKATIKSTNKFSIITLLEYDCISENDKQNDNPMTNERQTTRQSNDKPTILKEEYKEDKETKNAQAREGGGEIKRDYESGFERFWTAYPKKTAKSQAFKAFQKLNPDEELLNEILSSLERQKNSVQWTKEDGQYIPYPATWLNGKRWEDELTEVNSSSSNSKPKTEEEWLRGFNGISSSNSKPKTEEEWQAEFEGWTFG